MFLLKPCELASRTYLPDGPVVLDACGSSLSLPHSQSLDHFLYLLLVFHPAVPLPYSPGWFPNLDVSLLVLSLLIWLFPHHYLDQNLVLTASQGLPLTPGLHLFFFQQCNYGWVMQLSVYVGRSHHKFWKEILPNGSHNACNRLWLLFSWQEHKKGYSMKLHNIKVLVNQWIWTSVTLDQLSQDKLYILCYRITSKCNGKFMKNIPFLMHCRFV